MAQQPNMPDHRVQVKASGRGGSGKVMGSNGSGYDSSLDIYSGTPAGVGQPGNAYRSYPGFHWQGVTTPGGRAGYSIQRNGHTVTWLASNDGTRVKGPQV